MRPEKLPLNCITCQKDLMETGKQPQAHPQFVYCSNCMAVYNIVFGGYNENGKEILYLDPVRPGQLPDPEEEEKKVQAKKDKLQKILGHDPKAPEITSDEAFDMRVKIGMARGAKDLLKTLKVS